MATGQVAKPLVHRGGMNSFKDIDYQILKMSGGPLHSKVITKLAMEKGKLHTEGELHGRQ